jgi:polyhydroxybutyrate depolymerase
MAAKGGRIVRHRRNLLAPALLACVVLAAACSSATTSSSAGPPTGGTATTAAAAGGPGAEPAGTVASGTTPGTAVAPGAGSGPATGPARPSPGCSSTTVAGTTGLTPSTPTDLHVTIAGQDRVYRIFVPATLTPGRPVPLVLDLHGLTETRQEQAAVSAWEPLSVDQHFVVLTPQGAGRVPRWDAVPGAAGNLDAADNADITFISTITDATEHALCIDTSRVYVGGISNGGLMSSALACAQPQRWAAVGLVSGIVVPAGGCDTSRPVPAIVFWGKLDCVLPYSGGLGPCLFGQPPAPSVPGVTSTTMAGDVSRVPPVESAVAAWAARNGCGSQPTVTSISEHVEERVYSACSQGAAVDFYVISNGGHTWPGSKAALAAQRDASPAKGVTTTEIDATALIWQFYQRFQLP